MNARADRFPHIDAMRAIAALAVLGFHVAFFARVGGSESFIRPYTAHLDVGVTIFFLISGFLLYRPWVRARLRGEQGPRVTTYAWRRFLRITPAYWVALTVVAIWLSLPGVLTASGIPSYYGFAQIYSMSTSLGGIGQAWTLCVEVTFYALLPLWALLIRGIGGRSSRRVLATELAGLVVLFALSTVYKEWALHQVSPGALNSGPYLMPLPNFLDQFAIGMGLAVLSAWWEQTPTLPRPVQLLQRYPSAPWVLAVVAFWAVSTQIGYTGQGLQVPTRHMFLLRHELYSLVALGAVLPALLPQPARGFAPRLLGSRALLYLGLWSYGMYLYHLAVIREVIPPVQHLLPRGLGWRILGLGVLGLAGAVLLGALSYYLVERPALRLKGRSDPRSPSSRGEAIAEPAPAAPSPTPGA